MQGVRRHQRAPLGAVRQQLKQLLVRSTWMHVVRARTRRTSPTRTALSPEDEPRPARPAPLLALPCAPGSPGRPRAEALWSRRRSVTRWARSSCHETHSCNGPAAPMAAPSVWKS